MIQAGTHHPKTWAASHAWRRRPV
uniref:Uncharacterized protein n=1 Tax=Arundo donax TaxID=35708 RepID=A0A0A8YYP7_ARUDO